jgi:gamma-glutamylputrescine oxidase
MPYPDAVRDLGSDGARTLWRLSERALDTIETLAGDALRRVGRSLRLAVDESELDQLRAEADALAADGFDVDWLDRLPEPLRGLLAGGLRHPGDALQPARWVRRLAAHAASAGVEVREQSRLDTLDAVDASHVVIATDGYTDGLVPELDDAIRPTRGQVVVTEPLAAELFPGPHNARHGYHYWQQLPDRRLVIGGNRDAAIDDEATAEEAVTTAGAGTDRGRGGAPHRQASDHRAALVRHLGHDERRASARGPVTRSRRRVGRRGLLR